MRVLTETVPPKKPRRFLTLKAVLDRVPYSANHLARLEAAGDFPRRVKLSPNRVVWVEKEIDDYQEMKIRERDEPDNMLVDPCNRTANRTEAGEKAED